MSTIRRLKINTRASIMTKLTWMARMTTIDILPTITRLTRHPKLGRLVGLDSLDRLTMRAIAIIMGRLTGKGLHGGDVQTGSYGNAY